VALNLQLEQLQKRSKEDGDKYSALVKEFEEKKAENKKQVIQIEQLVQINMEQLYQLNKNKEVNDM